MAKKEKIDTVARASFKGGGMKLAAAADECAAVLEGHLVEADAAHARLDYIAAQFYAIVREGQVKFQDFRRRLDDVE